MRRIGVLVALLSALAATPTAAAACHRTTQGPRYTVRLAEYEPHQRLVLCDRRRGAERTIARTRGTPASYLGRAHVAGRRLTWPEVRVRERRDDAYVVRLTLPAGRPHRTLVATRPARPQSRSGTIGLEDGDRTLRWDYSYRDLRPLPLQNGCPMRERFRPLARLGDVQVTLAAYGGDDLAATGVFRVCRHGSRRDPVFTTTFSALGDGDGLTPVEPQRYSVSTGAFLGAGESRSECSG